MKGGDQPLTPEQQCFKDLRVTQDATGQFVCMYFHGLEKCMKDDKCDYSHAPELSFSKGQKVTIVAELERRRQAKKASKGKGGKGGKGKGGAGQGKGDAQPKAKPTASPNDPAKPKAKCKFLASPAGCSKGTDCNYSHE